MCRPHTRLFSRGAPVAVCCGWKPKAWLVRAAKCWSNFVNCAPRESHPPAARAESLLFPHLLLIGPLCGGHPLTTVFSVWSGRSAASLQPCGLSNSPTCSPRSLEPQLGTGFFYIIQHLSSHRRSLIKVCGESPYLKCCNHLTGPRLRWLEACSRAIPITLCRLPITPCLGGPAGESTSPRGGAGCQERPGRISWICGNSWLPRAGEQAHVLKCVFVRGRSKSQKKIWTPKPWTRALKPFTKAFEPSEPANP